MTERCFSDQLALAAARLARAQARFESEALMCHVLGRNRAWLFAHAEDLPTAQQSAAFAELVTRRLRGEPVAYLIGKRGFWTLDLDVCPVVLIPRVETELLVEHALARLPEGVETSVADLGTGSGAIALALASERPQAQVVAVDVSAQALAVAHANAERAALKNVRFCQGDWLAPLRGEVFDLIVSNPPYLAEDDAHLQQGDLPHEPRLALVSGSDGLDAIRRIVSDAPANLRAGGWLLLEHGWAQGAAVRALLGAAGFGEVATVFDLEARERVSLGRCQTELRP